MAPHQLDVRCSFCNKSEDEVKRIIAGAMAFICDECVQVCSEVLAADWRVSESSEGQDGRGTDAAAASASRGSVRESDA